MVNIHSLIRDRLHARANLNDNRTFLERAGFREPSAKQKFDKLSQTEWVSQFERLQRNRLIMGSIRYEPMSTKATDSVKYLYAEEAIKRLNGFITTGNSEHLVDAANLCMLSFRFEYHPTKHFASTDDGVHCVKQI